MIIAAALSERIGTAPVPGLGWIIATAGIIVTTGITASKPTRKPWMECPGLSNSFLPPAPEGCDVDTLRSSTVGA